MGLATGAWIHRTKAAASRRLEHSGEGAGLQQKHAGSEAESPRVALCTPSTKGRVYSTEACALLRSRDLRCVSGPRKQGRVEAFRVSEEHTRKRKC